jgi:Mg/Co/Ni transporter MgtE
MRVRDRIGVVLPQDELAPAASSIILTTVTDVVGFFSFLGIATLFASMLGNLPS